MAAGDGAAEQARRAMARAERLRSEVAQAERQSECWERGAVGERLVAAAVAPLAEAGWHALHDIRWPGRQRANIDHVLIGPGGVVVVDAKNWAGDVSVRDGVLRQNGYLRLRETQAVRDQAAAITALLEPGQRSSVRGWICLVGQAQMVASTALGVDVVGVERLGDMVQALPAVLDRSSINQVLDRLAELQAEPARLRATTAVPSLARSASGRAERARADRPAARRRSPGGAPRTHPPQRRSVGLLQRALLRLLLFAAMAAVILVGVHLVTTQLTRGMHQLGTSVPGTTTSPAATGPSPAAGRVTHP